MPTELTADILGLVSGVLVGFSLGLVGGGGSILSMPLMIYLVGVPSVHVAIGTTAFAVAVNAAVTLISHARMGTVNWSCAGVFAVAGMVGAYGGSSLSKVVDGQKLLVLFALLMLVIAAVMFARRSAAGDPDVKLTGENLPRLLGTGFLTGALSGFFGIGGGFLIVPGLIAATAMPLNCAIGSSLVAVTAFGVTTAVSYAASGLVDWRLAILFILGGAAGGALGIALCARLTPHRWALTLVFSAVVIVVGVYVMAAAVLGFNPVSRPA
jgi:uncharacterized protein